MKILPIAFLLASACLAQSALEQRLQSEIQKFPGTVALFARNLETGATVGRKPDERVRTASTIKLAIMATVFQAVADGRAKWTDTLPLTSEDKVSGSGVVRELSSGISLPLRDLVNLMIVVSDNTATNLLLDRFTANGVNAEMDRLGLKQTRSLRKILGDAQDLKPAPSGFSDAGRLAENATYGIGVSTPREMVDLVTMLARGEVVSAEASREMLAIMERQQYKDGIGRRFGNVKVASKSGALDHLRSDVGLVYSPGGRIALAITVDKIPEIDYSEDNPGLLLISRLAGIAVEGLSRRP